MSERYHLGGRVETDTVAMAAARQDQAGIQRRHRLERCHGEDPSQTPPFISLVARHEISQGTEEPPPQQPLQSANPSLETSLGVDVLLYPKVLLVLPVDVLLYPMILPSLGLDVLVCLMHHHRIVLPQVTLCPRHTGLGSEVSGRLYTAR